jgi:adenylate cyclase
MPVMDRPTLLTGLGERQSGVRAIILSAYGDMVNLRTAMNRGAFDFAAKPVDFIDLDITVRKALADIAKLREMDRLRKRPSARATICPIIFRRTSSSCWPHKMNRSG